MGVKVFITGIGGYLGSVLATGLAAMPEIEHITGIVNNTVPSSPLPPKVSLIRMDIRSPELADVMGGHDIVIHTAFLIQWSAKMPEAARDDINLQGTRNIAQAAVRNRVQKFIYASSIAAYDPVQVQGKDDVNEEFPIGKGDSPMYYWNSKAVAEKILTEALGSSGIKLTLLRLSYIIGPRNRITVRHFRENAANFPGCEPRAQFIHEDDAASAVEQAVRSNMPGAFNVVPDDYIRLSEVYKIIHARPMLIPLWLARLVTGIRWRYFGSPIHASWIQSALIDATLNNEKLKATGWKPHYSSRDAILTAVLRATD